MRFLLKSFTVLVCLLLFVIFFHVEYQSSRKNKIIIDETFITYTPLTNQTHGKVELYSKRFDSNVLCIIMTTEQTFLKRSLIGLISFKL